MFDFLICILAGVILVVLTYAPGWLYNRFRKKKKQSTAAPTVSLINVAPATTDVTHGVPPLIYGRLIRYGDLEADSAVNLPNSTFSQGGLLTKEAVERINSDYRERSVNRHTGNPEIAAPVRLLFPPHPTAIVEIGRIKPDGHKPGPEKEDTRQHDAPGRSSDDTTSMLSTLGLFGADSDYSSSPTDSSNSSSSSSSDDSSSSSSTDGGGGSFGGGGAGDDY